MVTVAQHWGQKHLVIGSFYSVVRILKCGPWSAGGLDEVKK